MNSVILFVLLGYGVEYFEKCQVLVEALNKAKETGKPLLNAGCGNTFLPAIEISDVNLDYKPRNVPRFVLASIENIPYPDGYFGSVFCSHVVEHVDNYKKAISELYRVADSSNSVFIIVPAPIWLSNWLNPNHKRIFVNNHIIELKR